VVGAYSGVALQGKAAAFDDPQGISRWDQGPQLAAILSELMEGLGFSTDTAHQRATLFFADLQADTWARRPVVTLSAPGADALQKQLELVVAYADLRSDRTSEIMSQIHPPMAFWAAVAGLQPHRHRKTLLLLDVALALSFQVYMRFKHMFAVPRPMEWSPQVQPMVPTPGHGALPSGHATESFIIATVLQAVLDAASPARGPFRGAACREQLQRLAARIAINRTVAGLHYPVDSAAGRVLGVALGEFMRARALGEGLKSRRFDGDRFQSPEAEPRDFRLLDDIDQSADGDQGAGHVVSSGSECRKALLLEWLWKQALKEWP
jgi:membrane-associated phospholipid phosphatase